MQSDRRTRLMSIVTYLHGYAVRNGWAASVEDVCQEMKINATTARYDLMKLDEQGYIVYQGSRQIKVLHLP